MLPDPKHPPSSLFHPCRCRPVSFAVSSKFFSPIGDVALGRAIAFRTTMPKAAVHENGDSCPWKDEIRSPLEFRMPPPTRYLGLP